MTKRPNWTITLHGSAEDLPPEGSPVKAISPTEATLTCQPGEVALHIALPTSSLADARWAAWHAVRRARAMFTSGPGRLLAGAGVSDDALRTIGLDLHHAFRGDLAIESAAVAVEVARIGEAEDRCRAWVNEDPSLRTSVAIAADIQAWANDRPAVELEILEEAALREAHAALEFEIAPEGRVSRRLSPRGATPGTTSHR